MIATAPISQTAFPRWLILFAACYAGLSALVNSWEAAIVWLLPLALLTGFAWTIFAPNNWLPLFFMAALLLPPLPLPLGDSGPHLAMAVAGMGLFAGLLRLHTWRIPTDGLSLAFLAFLSTLVLSLASAMFHSGPTLALASAARVGLFGIGVYIYFYVVSGPVEYLSPRKWARYLFVLATLAALFACLDFYYQFPAPAQFGPQFVWLDSGVYRRAQGLFYEASTLGNFCVFFLVMIAVALPLPRYERPLPVLVLILGGILLGIALIFSYSRASLLNLCISLVALAYVRRIPLRRLSSLMMGAFLAAAGAVYFLFPTFAQSYWTRLILSFQYFWSSPEGVLSGRVSNWELLGRFALENPLLMMFGVGFKTLPYSNIAGRPVIADNMYISLFIETGILGWSVFLLWNLAILRTAWKASRAVSSDAKFYGAWIFSFWVGQLFQMLSGDLLTYWRVLPAYFLVLGLAQRATREESL